MKEHDERLRSMLEAAERTRLTFNADKCTIGVEQVDFLGGVISNTVFQSEYIADTMYGTSARA